MRRDVHRRTPATADERCSRLGSTPEIARRRSKIFHANYAARLEPERHRAADNSLPAKHVVVAGSSAMDAGSTPAASTILLAPDFARSRDRVPAVDVVDFVREHEFHVRAERQKRRELWILRREIPVLGGIKFNANHLAGIARKARRRLIPGLTPLGVRARESSWR
jgi:hypothetical protein